MNRLTSGALVTGGYYFSIDRWEFTHVAEKGGALPGVGERYVRMPLPLLFTVAPLMGLLMVMFLPFIGFALTLSLVAKKVGGALYRSFFSLAALVRPAWRPGEAYLTGRRDTAPKGKADANESLDALEGEIAARRDTEKK
jgi:hypothetical protein